MSQDVAEISVIIGSFDEKAKYLDVCSSETAEKVLSTIRNLGFEYRDNGTSVIDLYNKLLNNLNLNEGQFREVLLKSLKESSSYYKTNFFEPNTKELLRKYKNVSLDAIKDIYENIQLEKYYYRYYSPSRSFVSVFAHCFSEEDFFPSFRNELISSFLKRLTNFEIINASNYGRKFQTLSSTCFVEEIYKKSSSHSDNLNYRSPCSQHDKAFMVLIREELDRRKNELKKEKEFVKEYTHKKKQIIKSNESINLHSSKRKLEENQETIRRLINTKMLSRDQLNKINQDYDKIVKDLEKTIVQIKEVIESNKSIE